LPSRASTEAKPIQLQPANFQTRDLKQRTDFDSRKLPVHWDRPGQFVALDEECELGAARVYPYL
jgi:hypothetical protein